MLIKPGCELAAHDECNAFKFSFVFGLKIHYTETFQRKVCVSKLVP